MPWFWGKGELASHLLLELKGCNQQTLDDLEMLKGILHGIVEDAPVLAERFYHFQPQGISGIMWTQSLRLYIHTWPEYNYAAVDVLAYQDQFQPQQVAKLLIDSLGTRESSILRLDRGFR